MEYTTELISSLTDETIQSTIITTKPYLRYIYIVIGILGMTGNIFVVAVIVNYTAMTKIITNWFIINQSLIDSMVAFFLILTSSIEDDGRVFETGVDSAFCQLWLTKVWLWGFLVSSTYNLLGMTIERYLAIVHPIWHKLNFKKKKCTALIIFAWLFGPAYNLAYMVPTSGITTMNSCTLYSFWPEGSSQQAVGILTIFVQFIIPFILLLVLYTRMILVLRRRVAPVGNNMVQEDNQSKKPDIMSRARRNLIKTLVLVGASFIVCWIWNQVYFLLFNCGYDKIDFASPFYHFTVVMVFCNCCLNPFIYIAKYEAFQKAVKRIFCKNQVIETSDNDATSVQIQ